MFDVNKIRKDFPILKGVTMQNNPLIYLDSAATTLKPQCVIDAVCDYLTLYSANAHRGDYDLSYQVDTKYEKTRQIIADFIDAPSDQNIVFTYGTTDGLNMVAQGFVEKNIGANDEILISVSEHASNILPWFDVADKTNAKIKYIDLDDQGRITLENVKKAITKKTKYIAIAQMTNVLGNIAPIKEICALAHQYDIKVIVDGAQSTPHMKVSMIDLDCDFFVFSGHKMCGPTGVGILYGKAELLEIMVPTRHGGGSNARFYYDGRVNLKEAPAKFEAGTPNIEGVIGLGAAIQYLKEVGMDNIHAYEQELRKYAIEKLLQLDNIEIYNVHAAGPIAFNIKGVFSQDGASLFNKHGMAVRSGQHCAKILNEYLDVNHTLRMSLYLYNTKEEIDEFIRVCQKGDDFLDAFFG